MRILVYLEHDFPTFTPSDRQAEALRRALPGHGLKRNPRIGTEGADRVVGPDRLLEALPAADHVVCILPGGTGTDGLLGREAFARMKHGAAVYNIGRGNAIDAAALEEALRAGRVAAAFLDVLPEEPLPAESTLWSAPNLFITPHVSAVATDYLDLYFAELVPLLRSLREPG